MAKGWDEKQVKGLAKALATDAAKVVRAVTSAQMAGGQVEVELREVAATANGALVAAVALAEALGAPPDDAVALMAARSEADSAEKTGTD